MEIRERINELERQLTELKASLKAKDDRPITERVRTIKGALDVLGDDHPFVQQFDEMVCDGVNKDNADLLAYYKLRIIAAALNEGWEPQFTEDEYRYFPWFKIKDGGVACAYSGYDSSYANTSFGARFAFKTSELAEYAGRQFEDIWADYLLARKQSVPAEGAMA